MIYWYAGLSLVFYICISCLLILKNAKDLKKLQVAVNLLVKINDRLRERNAKILAIFNGEYDVRQKKI